jgi:hypothetical protein
MINNASLKLLIISTNFKAGDTTNPINTAVTNSFVGCDSTPGVHCVRDARVGSPSKPPVAFVNFILGSFGCFRESDGRLCQFLVFVDRERCARNTWRVARDCRLLLGRLVAAKHT